MTVYTHFQQNPWQNVPLIPPSLSPPAVSESAAVTGLGSGSGSQGCRLEDGGGAGGSLPVLRVHQNRSQAVLSHLMANADNSEPDDDFFNMLVKCQVCIIGWCTVGQGTL